MTTDTWTAGTGNWTTTSDWSLGSPPTSSEDAFIGSGSGGTVTSNGNETVNSIGVASGYTLAIGGTLSPGTFFATTGTGASQSIAGSLVVAVNGNFEASSQIVNSGTIELAGSGGPLLHSASLEASGNLTIDQIGGQILLQGTVGPIILSNGTAATLNLNGGTLAGVGQVGDSNLTLNIGQGTIIDGNGVSLSLNTGSNIITNNGVLEATSGGLLFIESPVSNNNGTIFASSGMILVSSEVEGGTVEIGGGGTLSVASTADIAANVQFTAPNANLYLSAPNLIGGFIIGLEANDFIHESSLAFAAGDHAVWSQNGSSGTLTIETSSRTALATLMLAGAYTPGQFEVTADISNDVQITVAQPVTRDDFTGNGISDMLWRSASGTMAEWLMNGSTVSSSSALTSQGSAVTPNSSWNIVAIADFDGAAVSRDADILWRSSSAGALIEWQMSGPTIEASAAVTSQGIAVAPDSSWSVAGIGDFNGDGKDDVLWRQSTTGTLADWSMNGSTIEASAAITSQGNAVTPDSSWSVAGIGDFDGSQGATATNIDDILWRNSNTGSLAMWLMNGSAIETSSVVTYQGSAIAPDSTWTIAEVGDFNGSNEAGIVWQQSTTGSVVEWQMNGSQIVSSSPVTQALIPVTQTAISQANPTDSF